MNFLELWITFLLVCCVQAKEIITIPSGFPVPDPLWKANEISFKMATDTLYSRQVVKITKDIEVEDAEVLLTEMATAKNEPPEKYLQEKKNNPIALAENIIDYITANPNRNILDENGNLKFDNVNQYLLQRNRLFRYTIERYYSSVDWNETLLQKPQSTLTPKFKCQPTNFEPDTEEIDRILAHLRAKITKMYEAKNGMVHMKYKLLAINLCSESLPDDLISTDKGRKFYLVRYEWTLVVILDENIGVLDFPHQYDTYIDLAMPNLVEKPKLDVKRVEIIIDEDCIEEAYPNPIISNDESGLKSEIEVKNAVPIVYTDIKMTDLDFEAQTPHESTSKVVPKLPEEIIVELPIKSITDLINEKRIRRLMSKKAELMMKNPVANIPSSDKPQRSSRPVFVPGKIWGKPSDNETPVEVDVEIPDSTPPTENSVSDEVQDSTTSDIQSEQTSLKSSTMDATIPVKSTTETIKVNDVSNNTAERSNLTSDKAPVTGNSDNDKNEDITSSDFKPQTQNESILPIVQKLPVEVDTPRTVKSSTENFVEASKEETATPDLEIGTSNTPVAVGSDEDENVNETQEPTDSTGGSAKSPS